jgi:murein DD-endopeptidase MepM/ murein hydrolase activator NlpD
MRSSFRPVAVTSLLMLAVCLNLAAAQKSSTGRHWTFINQPSRLFNGSPVLFRVTTPTTLQSLSGTWMGHEIRFSFDPIGKQWFALAGVSQETKPGTYSLDLHGESSSTAAISFEKKIQVVRRRYPRILLKVAARYTAPNPDDQREIAKDKEIKADAFKTASADRAWKGSFAAPVDAPISDIFGVERVFNGSVQSTHQGLDFRVPSGTPIAAVNSGRVILARALFFEGNCVVIDHGQGLLTLYLHMSKFAVKEGDEVSKGQNLGLSGGTGRATGPHLHLAVRWQGVYVDPKILLGLKLP